MKCHAYDYHANACVTPECYSFGARILDQQFYRGKDYLLFIQFKALSQFYQKLALDIHIMSLWTM
jgi:hypothetical protein